MIHSTNANATRHDVGGTASTRISSDSRTRVTTGFPRDGCEEDGA
jgi:hypothetical protein